MTARGDARKRLAEEAAASPISMHSDAHNGLTEAEREDLGTNLRWHFACHAAEPDKHYDSLGVENAILRVARIKAEAVQAERERVAEWLESDGAVEAVATVLEIAIRPDELVYEFQERQARSALAALAGYAKGETDE